MILLLAIAFSTPTVGTNGVASYCGWTAACIAENPAPKPETMTEDYMHSLTNGVESTHVDALQDDGFGICPAFEHAHAGDTRCFDNDDNPVPSHIAVLPKVRSEDE